MVYTFSIAMVTGRLRGNTLKQCCFPFFVFTKTKMAVVEQSLQVNSAEKHSAMDTYKGTEQ